MDLVELLQQIDRKKAELDAKAIDDEKIEAYRSSYLSQAVFNSAALDGNALTFEDVSTILEQNQVIPGKTMFDHLAVFGLFLARRLAEKMIKEQTKLSEYNLKLLHQTILFYKPAIAGNYRDFNMQVNDHRATDFNKVPYKMTQLIDNLTQSEGEHPVARAAFFHLRLEKVHPFGDGNGRLGRLASNIILAEAGYPQVVFPLPERQRYFDAISAYEGLNGNPTKQPMELLLAETVDKQLDQLLAL
ncbi:MAG: Fic family protein [Coriobacteriales bacterium]|jgi:Fic family protein|nr:Fic family protein [Coriobacteriales bacterium]